jgi:hypothetical protein
MLKRLRLRLTYANVMSTIAAFAALATGGAYAAGEIGPNDIAKNAVRAKHIKANAVRGSEVKANSIEGVDLNEATLGQVPLAATADSAGFASSVASNSISGGSVQDQALTGADIDESTLAGFSGLETVLNESPSSNSNSPKFAIAKCPAGKRVLTGTFAIEGAQTGEPPSAVLHVGVDTFAIEDTQVLVSAYEVETFASNWGVNAYARCVNAP